MAKLQESYEEEEVEIERHIQYNKRGELKMVGQKSLFDLDEPVWHADEKVSRQRFASKTAVSDVSIVGLAM